MTRIVGLTGGIASGKSTVAQMLAARGAVVIDADQLAREVTGPGAPALAEIISRFGPSVMCADGSLDRAALARVIFEDTALRRELERITHPRIRARTEELIEEARRRGDALVVYEAPLFFELNLDQWIREVIVVDVDPETQRQRLLARNDASALARIDHQLPIAEKRARATHLIDNRNGYDETRAQVDALWPHLTGERG